MYAWKRASVADALYVAYCVGSCARDCPLDHPDVHTDCWYRNVVSAPLRGEKASVCADITKADEKATGGASFSLD